MQEEETSKKESQRQKWHQLWINCPPHFRPVLLEHIKEKLPEIKKPANFNNDGK